MHYTDYLGSRPVYKILDGAEGFEFYATRGATVLDAFMAWMSTGLIPEHAYEMYARLAEAIDAGDRERIARAIGDIPDIRVYVFDDESGEYSEIPGEGDSHE